MLAFLEGVFLELLSMALRWVRKNRYAQLLIALVFLGIGLNLAWIVLARIFSRPVEPFSYRRVHGIVSYEDGDLIPADSIVLTFLPILPPLDNKTFPRPGIAIVEAKTGRFDTVTSHRAGDGLVRGKHRVTVTGDMRRPLPDAIVPPEYADQSRSPLEVDTGKLPFVIKVRRPATTTKKR